MLLTALSAGLLLSAYLSDIFTKKNTAQSIGRPNILILSFCSLKNEYLPVYGNIQKGMAPNLKKFNNQSYVFTNTSNPTPWTNININLWPKNSLFFKKNGYRHIGYNPSGSRIFFKIPKMPFSITKKTSLPPEQEGGEHITNWHHNVKDSFSKLKRLIKEQQNYATPFFLTTHIKYMHYPFIDIYNKEVLSYASLNKQEKHFLNNPPLHSSFFYQLLFGKSKTFHFKKNLSSLQQLYTKNFSQLTDRSFVKKWKNSINYKLELKIIKKLYAAKLKFLDFQLKDILNLLNISKLQKNTVIILVGDHGEAMMEHGHILHSTHLYEEFTKFPLVIKLPKSSLKKPVKLSTFTTPISLKYIIEKLVQKKITEKNFVDKVKKINKNHNDLTFIRSCDYSSMGVRTANYKLIYNIASNTKQFFNLNTDLLEKHNLYNQNLPITVSLEQKLFDVFLNRQENRRTNRACSHY